MCTAVKCTTVKLTAVKYTTVKYNVKCKAIKLLKVVLPLKWDTEIKVKWNTVKQPLAMAH